MPMDRRGPMPKPKSNRQIIDGMFNILRTGSPYFHCAPLSRRSAQ